MSKDGKKSHHYFDCNLRLPTPPPDPTGLNSKSSPTPSSPVPNETKSHNVYEETFQKQINSEIDAYTKEHEFLEYLLSLSSSTTTPNNQPNKPQFSRTNSLFAQAIAADDAFDHLEKLYKLMEQLLNLREQNSKLQKRIRDLEHFRAVHKMHQNLHFDDKIALQDLESDPIYAENLLDNIVTAGRKRHAKFRPGGHFRFRQSLLGKRGSVFPDEPNRGPPANHLEQPYHEVATTDSAPATIATPKSAKVSKWTKVKAAFKWERACATVAATSRSQDSGISGILPLNNEVARYLKVPTFASAYGDGGGGATSPADSLLSGQSSQELGASGKDTSTSLPPTPASLSSISSVEDLHHLETANRGKLLLHRLSTCSDDEEVREERRSKSFDDDAILEAKDDEAVFHSKTWQYGTKQHKTPWSKVKDIITQTRKDSLKKSPPQAVSSKPSDEYKVELGENPRRSSSIADICSLSSGHEEYPEVFLETVESKTNEGRPSVGTKPKRLARSRRPAPMPALTVTIPSTDILPQEVVRRYKELATSEASRSNSKWIRVKRAFLNRALDGTKQSASVPNSPARISVFFPEDSDLADDSKDEYIPSLKLKRKLQQEFSHPQSNRQLQDEIRRNYEELQTKLSLEFQEKILEWERIKNQNPTTTSTVAATPSTAPSSSPLEEPSSSVGFQKKIDEWNRIKNPSQSPKSDSSSPKPSALTIPMTPTENLSADFKKKLQEWQKIKRENPSTTKRKITDWQLFKPTTSNPNPPPKPKPPNYPDATQLSEDFLKKLEEWKKMKATNSVPSYSKYTDEEDPNRGSTSAEAKTPSPRLGRKDSGNLKSPQSSTKKTKNQDDKELQWLEKQLQKIEREKQRLEKEREKFLDREERLAKLRRSIGGHQQKKEVLVQTSTGFFRFQGISRKFTQRLYEWEKARGIGPDESTLMLLNPRYKPTPLAAETRNSTMTKKSSPPGVRLVRSKSMDSVANLIPTNSSITHQPSSLSLNDVEELEAECLAESRAGSEVDQDFQEVFEEADEPEAMIVDVEDVVEETAAPLDTNVAIPSCVSHTPVYRYEQQEDDMMCEGEECQAPKVQGYDDTKSSYHLIEENICLLNKLKDKEEICRQLEVSMEGVEDEINKIERAKLEESERIKKSEVKNSRSMDSEKSQSRIKELDRHSQRLKFEGVTLQNSFAEHTAQQTVLAQHLVASIRRLQETNSAIIALNAKASNVDSKSAGYVEDITEMIQDLSSELLHLAEKLATTLADRNQEIQSLQRLLQEHQRTKNTIPMSGKQWHSIDFGNVTKSYLSLSRHNMIEAKQLPSMLSNKMLELKRCLNYICDDAPGITSKKVSEPPENIPETIPVSQEITTQVTITPKFLRKPSLPEPTDEKIHPENEVFVEAKISLKKPSDDQQKTAGKSTVSSSTKRKTRIRKPDIKDSETGDSDDEDENLVKRNLVKPRKNSRNRVLSETSQEKIEKISIRSTKSSSEASSVIQVSSAGALMSAEESRAESPEVFVKTTRKIFTPICSNDNIAATSTSVDVDEKEDQEKCSDLPEIPVIKSPGLYRRHLQKSSSSDTIPESSSASVKECRGEMKLYGGGNFEYSLAKPNSNPLTPELKRAQNSCLPPLPNSPTPLRRDRFMQKETAPSIRMMIARYNRRLSEQEGGKSPGGSSGSASPIAWRSPVFERRVRAQTEKYQEDLKRVLKYGHWRGSEIMKSASAGVIQTPETTSHIPKSSSEANDKLTDIPVTPPPSKLLRGILKSSSAGSLKSDRIPKPVETKISVEKTEDSPVIPEESKSNHQELGKIENTPPKIIRKYETRVPLQPFIPSSPESTSNSPLSKIRALKIQQAKQEFLARTTSSFESPTLPEVETKSNRLSQASCGSESSYDNSDGLLIKSASAGMINVDATTYHQLTTSATHSELHSDGYVSLPRPQNKSSKDIPTTKFGLASSIASKFRKVKMRRQKDGNKDPSKMNTISMLCRQSLLVDINSGESSTPGQSTNVGPATSTSDALRSKSTSASPIFNRQLLETRGSTSSCSSWKTKIFKPKQ